MQDNQIIDLHSHILPNMDDGSPNVDTSLAMLWKMVEQGVTGVCATSHYYAGQNDIPTFYKRRQKAYMDLRTVIQGENLPEILLAAEVTYFQQIEAQDLAPLCIQGTRTLMLEMPYVNWTDLQVDTVISLVLDHHYNIVLVHPEQFCFSGSNRSKLRRLATLPIGLQINAESLIHWSTRHLALELLEMAPYPLLGSDCHNLAKRPPNLKEGREIVRKKLGGNFLREIDENAGKIVHRMG